MELSKDKYLYRFLESVTHDNLLVQINPTTDSKSEDELTPKKVLLRFMNYL